VVVPMPRLVAQRGAVRTIGDFEDEDDRAFFEEEEEVAGRENVALESPEREIAGWIESFIPSYHAFVTSNEDEPVTVSCEAGSSFIPFGAIAEELIEQKGMDPRLNSSWVLEFEKKYGQVYTKGRLHALLLSQPQTFILKQGRFQERHRRLLLVALRAAAASDNSLREEIIDTPPRIPYYFDMEAASTSVMIDELLIWLRDFVPERNHSLRRRCGERVHVDAAEDFMPVSVIFTAICDKRPRWGLRAYFQRRYRRLTGAKLTFDGLMQVLCYYDRTFTVKEGRFVVEDAEPRPLVAVLNRLPFSDPSVDDDADEIKVDHILERELVKPKWAQDQFILRERRRKEWSFSKVLF